MPVEWFPTALRAAIPGASFLALSALERARPLRHETHSKWRRLGVNAGFAFTGGACFGACYAGLVIPAARWGELYAWGALRWLGAPPLDQMTEAVHVAAAIRGGASLVHGVQMRSVAKKVGM